MGYNISTQRSVLFNEFSADERKKFFNLSVKKFIPHVDTLYYSIFLKNDMACSKDEVHKIPDSILEFIDFCKFAKSQFDPKDEMFSRDFWLDYEESLLFSKRSFSIYDFCIRKEGYYDIFISEYIPNENTPRIVVQLRSIGLWTLGEYELILESYNSIKKLLSSYGIEIDRVQENRIDFCYHTNCIQNPFKFYCDTTLTNNLHTTFKLGSKVFNISRKKLEFTYLSLGKRKSNNLFFRSYNKVREVIEENYKEFFIDFWYNSGLINKYDHFIYSYAYQHKNYNYIYWGMLEFYLKYGKDKKTINSFKFIKEHSREYTLDDIKNIVSEICPIPTHVLNIEFQCMRKFFYSFDKSLDKIFLPISHECDFELLKLFQILDNRKLFLDYLTSEVVSFEKVLSFDVRKKMRKDPKESENIYLDFWKRLRSCKIPITCSVKIDRDYSRKINREIIVSKIKSALATLSLYDGHFDTDINDDFSSLITVLNDNDFKVSQDGVITIIDNEYMKIKENRKKALKSIIEQSRPSIIN